MHCRNCAASFANIEEYRLHYRDDWHRYNIKLKLKGKSSISQEEFCEIEDDISSISGSESENETVSRPSVGSAKISFKNCEGLLMSIYCCLLHPKKVQKKFSSCLLFYYF